VWGEEDCLLRFGGEPERNTPLGKKRHRCEDNIKMDLQEVGSVGMDWIDLSQDRDRWWPL